MAPDDDQESVGVVLMPVAPFAGDGDVGVPGAEPDPELVIVTESNVDVLLVVVSWLVTISPMEIVAGREIVVDPTGFHVTPSLEVDALTVEPLRTSLSHEGIPGVALPTMLAAAPVLARVMNSRLPFGVRSSMTCWELAASDARSMMPAFA